MGDNGDEFKRKVLDRLTAMQSQLGRLEAVLRVVGSQVADVQGLSHGIYRKEQEIMDIEQAIIDAVTEEAGVVNSIVVLIQRLASNGITDPQAIIDAIHANRDQLQAAIVANP